MIHFIEKKFFSRFEHLINVFEKFDLKYQVVEVLKTKIKFEPVDTTQIYCWGSVRMAHLAKKYGWTPGSLYNTDHDYRVYSQYYKENMLNWDSQIIGFADDFKEPGFLFHVRPCEDTKTFTGMVSTRSAWDEYVTWRLNGKKSKLKKDTPIQISSLKEIYEEIRFFIVDGKIITASTYRKNDRMFLQENNEPILYDFVNDMIKLYQPANSFVMDIAKTKNGLKIIELNCINCSGFYDVDMQKLVMAIENKFNNYENIYNRTN